MYTTDPFQFTVAGYRLAGMMFENQMRVMLAITDASFSGKNPFITPPVSRRERDEHNVAARPTPSKPQIARVVKPSATPETVKRKSRRRSATPPPVMSDAEVLHPAE